MLQLRARLAEHGAPGFFAQLWDDLKWVAGRITERR